MNNQDGGSNGKMRETLAIYIVIVSIVVVGVLSAIAIHYNQKDSMTILNMVFPVIGTWVGTVLAFYFGKENFESANMQVREMVQKLTPKERENTTVSTVMRGINNITFFKLTSSDYSTIKISSVIDKFNETITRIPLIDENGVAKFMLHESSVNKYLNSGGKKDDTLDIFLKSEQEKGIEFGENKGFITVSKTNTLKDAKSKLEANKISQDIFVTENGQSDEKLIGWLSNTRLAKYINS